MGLSIFLSLPVILSKSMRSRTITFLSAAAIGILVFLLADIFGNIAPLIAGSAAYLTIPSLDLLFVGTVAGIFTVLYAVDQGIRTPAPLEGAASDREGRFRPSRLAFMIAISIGFQNLTEGLVFGSSWSRGQVGLLAVIFVGFLLQNITEGFPIVSPFLGRDRAPIGTVAVLFFVGGLPTIVGGAVGYFWSNTTLTVLFDALAIGAILYVLVPMLKVALRTDGDRVASYRKQRIVYFGLLVGFLVGFAVNAF